MVEVAGSRLDGACVRRGQAGRVVGDVERGDQPAAVVVCLVGDLCVG
jgi:hypothetical protein